MDHLYDDLDVFEDIDVEYKKVQNINQDLTKKISFLEAEVAKLNDVVLQMKKQQEQLEKNISSLYNTAKAECERKDRQIAELQQRLDDVVFRRTDKRDFQNVRSASRASSRSDSGRSARHKSRSVSPVHKVRNIQERRVSPRKRVNEGPGPRTPPPPSVGGRRDSNKDGSRDARNNSTHQEERNRSRKCMPVKRYRPSESKSPTGKRGRYEGNGRHDNHRSRTPPRKPDPAIEKVDKSCKATENHNNTDKTQSIPKKEEILNVSVEDGEIIESCETKNSSVNNAESNNKCKNEKSKDAKHGRRGRQHDAHQRVEKPAKVSQKVDKNVCKPEIALAAEVTHDQVTSNKDNLQNPPVDVTKIPEEKPAEPRKDEFRLLAVEVPEYAESTDRAPTVISDVSEPVKNQEAAIAPEVVKKQPSPKITSFTGVLSSEETRRKLFAPKPTKAVEADVLFGSNPLTSSPKTKAAWSERSQRPEPKSAPPAIENASHANNARTFDSADESVRAMSRAESKDSASSLDTSLHLCLSDDNKSVCSNNGDTTVICTHKEDSTPEANGKDNKENVQNKSVVSPGGETVQSATELAVASPAVAGRGKARPRRRGGFVKVVD